MITAEVKISTESLLGLEYPMQIVGIDWETYEGISEELGESTPLHLNYNDGRLTIMPTTELHELLTSLLHDFIRFAGFALKINVVATGKATLRSKRRKYGTEPDLAYFVGKSDIHQVKDYIPNEVELAPDIAAEIDIYHSSEDRFEVFGAFGISEFWQYKNENLKIFRLDENDEYREIERSREIPILTSVVLTEFLKRGQNEEQFAVLSDFQHWLQENK